MNEPAIRPPSAVQRWPMTGGAWHSLVDELDHLRIDLAVLAGAAPDDDVGDEVVHFPAYRAARRFDVLASVLDAAQRVDEPDRAVIGRRVTLREEQGDTITYALVFPGDGDPTQGWISADSPLGAAVLGHAAGDTVEVMAPAGTRLVTLVRVE